MAEEPVRIRLDGVGKAYSDHAALTDVTLTIPAGAFCVLLGPSGAGKSTLLRCLNGLTIPSTGTIEICGRPVAGTVPRTLRGCISSIHQQTALVDRLTVGQNVMAPAATGLPLWRGIIQWYPPAVREAAVRAVREVGLDANVLGRRAGGLSGGERQRVGIARALVTDPAVIVADEPVASLDPPMALQVMRLLREAALQRKATVVCSLHQVDLALEFADLVVGLRQGRVMVAGPPAAVDRATVKALYRRETIISGAFPRAA